MPAIRAGGAVEEAGIEEHRRDVQLALELFEERGGAIHGEERAGTDDEDDVALAAESLEQLQALLTGVEREARRGNDDGFGEWSTCNCQQPE